MIWAPIRIENSRVPQQQLAQSFFILFAYAKKLFSGFVTYPIFLAWSPNANGCIAFKQETVLKKRKKLTNNKFKDLYFIQ